MLSEAEPLSRLAILRRRLRGLSLVHGLSQRLGWGLADQAVSSLTNYVVVAYIAHVLGAVPFGAFSLAYVTYSFILNASRGLATDPFLVRFSGASLQVWRRAVPTCTGCAIAVGAVGGAGMLVAALLLGGTAGAAFLAMGLTMPGLMLQDSWRNAFFALGRGNQAFANDAIWALAMVPILVAFRLHGYNTVFWVVLAWGMAGNVAAAVGPLQARVWPNLAAFNSWISEHRDLAPRYLVEETSGSAASQLRSYGLGALAGLVAVGYLQAAGTLMGPFLVILMGVSLVTVPEAARVLRHSPRHLLRFCATLGGVLTAGALAWAAILLVTMPRGIGQLALGSLWRPTYPLVLPMALSVVGGCISAGATAGLRALGVAKRSLRAELFASGTLVVCSLLGAYLGGVRGAIWGGVFSSNLAAIVWWRQLTIAARDRNITAVGQHRSRRGKPAESRQAGEPEATLVRPSPVE